MRRNISSLTIVFCIVLLATAFTNFSFSQEQQEPQSSLMVDIQVKPGMQFEFEKFLKDELIPAMKKGGSQELGVWNRAVFGTANNYILSMPMTGMAEFDNPPAMFTALGQYGAQAMLSKMTQFADSARIYAITQLPDLAIASQDGYVPKIGFHARATVAPGRDAEYLKNAKVVSDLIKKTSAKGFYAHRVGIGGNPNQFYFLVLLDSFADMEVWGQSFQKAVAGTEMPSMAGIVQLMEYSMYGYNAELSIRPAQ